MFDLQSAKFVSTVDAPPLPLAEPAYWFLFQADKLLVRSGPYMGEALQAHDADELGIEPDRTQYMGYLEDAHSGRVHCYSGDIAAGLAIPSGMTTQGLRELHAQLGDILFASGGPRRADRQLGPHAPVLRPVRHADRDAELRAGEEMPGLWADQLPAAVAGHHHRRKASHRRREPHSAGAQPPLSAGAVQRGGGVCGAG